MEAHKADFIQEPSLDEIIEVDLWARRLSRTWRPAKKEVVGVGSVSSRSWICALSFGPRARRPPRRRRVSSSSAPSLRIPGRHHYCRRRIHGEGAVRVAR